MRIQLLAKSQNRKFVQGSSPKKWTIDGNADRSKDAYVVVVLPDDLTKVVVTPGDEVVIHYSDSKLIHFKSTGKKTRITGEESLALNTNQELKYNGFGGFIALVEVDGHQVYASEMLDPALQIVLLDTVRSVIQAGAAMTHVAQLSLKQVWSDNPRILLAVAAFAALLTGTVSYGVFKLLAAGDEPPIRVRHRSIILEVVHVSQHWRQVGSDQRHWKLSQGTRRGDEYQLYFAPTNPAHCHNAVNVRGLVVRFVLNNDQQMWVQLQSTNRKTDVTSSVPLELSADEKELSFGGVENFVTSITVDGTERCSFTTKDAGLHTVVTE